MKKIGILMIVLALAACASSGDKPKDDKSDKKTETKVSTDNLICPQVAIVTEAQRHEDFGGENPEDPTQLVAVAEMEKVDGDCAYRDKGIDIAFTLHMRAHRGPRLGGNKISFPFYVAVVDPSETIMNRQLMTANFSFSGDGNATDDEALHVFIPLSKDALLGGPSYRVLMGFK